jgi:hypothetical protein
MCLIAGLHLCRYIFAELRRRGLLELIYRGGLNRGTSVYRVHPLPRADAT